MQKLLPKFFLNMDIPDIIYEDAAARDDDEDTVKYLLFHSKTSDFLQIGRRCVEERTFDKAHMNIQASIFSKFQLMCFFL